MTKRPTSPDSGHLPLDDPETDSTEPLLCSRCDATISDTQLEDGSAITRHGRSLCPDCTEVLRQLRKRGGDRSDDEAAEHSLMDDVGIAAGSIDTTDTRDVPAPTPPPVPAQAPPAPAGDRTEQLVAELHHLVRELGREKFSLWNILGGMAQAGALFALVMLLFDPTNQTRLMWGIFVQMMALSFFTVGRK